MFDEVLIEAQEKQADDFFNIFNSFQLIDKVDKDFCCILQKDLKRYAEKEKAWLEKEKASLEIDLVL